VRTALVSGHCAVHRRTALVSAAHALFIAAPPLYRGIALVIAAPPLYRGVALFIAASPLYRGVALVMPHRPCIGALRWSCRTALVSGHCAGNGRTAFVSGLVVLVIGGVLVFGVFPTYLSTFFSVAAEFILRVYVQQLLYNPSC
jgi:hypothetical protein